MNTDMLNADTTPLKKVVLFTLANDESGRLRLEDIAHRVGVAVSTLCVALTEMRADGWIDWKSHPNLYTVHPERIPQLVPDSGRRFPDIRKFREVESALRY